MTISLLFSLFNLNLYAISPADNCATKPTVNCEVLNVDVKARADNAGTAFTDITKKYFELGQFKVKYVYLRYFVSGNAPYLESTLTYVLPGTLCSPGTVQASDPSLSM